MTTNQILIGVGLILVLAVGAQVLASRLRIPALIVLLPAGFIAGALTTDVNPERLLGPAFEPLVSLSVAVILYDAGLGLDLRKLKGHVRKVVIRLIILGVLITWVLAASVAAPLLGMSRGAAVMLGIILVVSGPTVVGPLLRFVRPAERLQQVLIWEGSLIDPVGGILGALVFHAVISSTHKGLGSQLGQFAVSVLVGLAGGIIGTVLLWLLLRKLRLGELLGTTAQLAAVIGVAAGCDVARADTGLIAAIFMGLALANQRGFDLPARQPFFETLVQLIIGVLFISISATVTPQSLRHLVLPTLGLTAVLVFVARPLAAFASTLRTDLTKGERVFIGWMAPRGIVAAATASTFTAGLVAKDIGGAAKILPVTFLVIVVTVTLYGLTAAPVARRLHVTRPARTRPLLVGGDLWVIDLGRALRSAGLEVLMWAGLDQQRKQIGQAGLELAPGELLAAATGRGARLEEITAVLLLTDEDDFNALASVLLTGNVEGRVYRLAPPLRSHGVVAPYTSGEILFGEGMTRGTFSGRYHDGARIVVQPANGVLPRARPPVPRARGRSACCRHADRHAGAGGRRHDRVPGARACGPVHRRVEETMNFHVRLVSAPDRTDVLLEALGSNPGVSSLVVLPGAARRPGGDAVQFDVRPGSANSVFRHLKTLQDGHTNPVAVEYVDATLGEQPAPASKHFVVQRDLAPVWELVEARIRSDAVYAPSFYVLLAIAGLIGAVGILTNSQILIVGAMVVGPEYNAIMGVALGIDKRTRRPVLRGLLALLVGFAGAMVVTLFFGLVIRWSGHTPGLYALGVRPVSDLINNPNLFSVVVAVLAGIVGVVSLTEARASALIGVFISVTTIPAAADVGLSLAYSSWSEARGSAFQLLLNVVLLIAVGAAALRVQRIIWRARERPDRSPNGPGPG